MTQTTSSTEKDFASAATPEDQTEEKKLVSHLAGTATSEKTKSGRTVYRIPIAKLHGEEVSYTIDRDTDRLDPIILGYDGDVIDGHHRLETAKEEGKKSIRAIVAGEKDSDFADHFGGLRGHGSASEENWIEWMHRGNRAEADAANQKPT